MIKFSSLCNTNKSGGILVKLLVRKTNFGLLLLTAWKEIYWQARSDHWK